MTFQIAALVVTYNRRPDLANCIAALRNQSRIPDRIVIINNCSTDDTGDFLRGLDNDGDLKIITLPSNTGGAGGFSMGVAVCIELGYDAAWLMDDDVIPTVEALESLEAGWRQAQCPGIAASLVLDTAGNIGPRNKSFPAQAVDWNSYVSIVAAAERSSLAIEHTSFVGCLVNLAVARDTHLPLADFFIWHDDTEYSYRLASLAGGVLIPDSRVVHLAEMAAPGSTPGNRVRFDVRNRIWLMRQRDAHWPIKLSVLISVVGLILQQARLSERKLGYLRRALAAFIEGFVRSPRRDTWAEAVARLRALGVSF